MSRSSRRLGGAALSSRALVARNFGRRLALEYPDLVGALLQARDNVTGYMTADERAAHDTLLPATFWAAVDQGYRAGLAEWAESDGE